MRDGLVGVGVRGDPVAASVLFSNVACVDCSKPAAASPVGTCLNRAEQPAAVVLALAIREGEHDRDKALGDEALGDEALGEPLVAIEVLGGLMSVDGKPCRLPTRFCTRRSLLWHLAACRLPACKNGIRRMLGSGLCTAISFDCTAVCSMVALGCSWSGVFILETSASNGSSVMPSVDATT